MRIKDANKAKTTKITRSTRMLCADKVSTVSLFVAKELLFISSRVTGFHLVKSRTNRSLFEISNVFDRKWFSRCHPAASKQSFKERAQNRILKDRKARSTPDPDDER